MVYLRVDIGISDDRSRYELREERDEHQEVYEGLLRLDIAFVNIERIGHRLECIERNAYRQRKCGNMEREAEDSVERGNEKSAVFECREQT